jgi:peptidoglycan/xylan/chitin deacetylase (PgdA/CDA1 family)
MKKYPYVSVVVPAYNEEELISKCIDSLKNQDYKGEYEIIVVNNASSDATGDIAKSMGAKVIYEGKRGYINALIAGFNFAKGEIICCTDADTMVPNDWISNFVNNLLKDGVVACTGTFLFHDGPQMLQLIGKFFGNLNYHLAGANMAVWKYAYEKVGGFNKKVNMGADVELGLRLKRIGKVLIDRKIKVKTSARRFQFAFFQTLWLYYLNDFGLHFLGRPIFYDFPNIRRTNFLQNKINFSFARFAIACSVLLFIFWFTQNTENKLFGDVFARGSILTPYIALTFDDGPSEYTQNILDTLSKYNVRATFFLIGKNVEKYPQIARRIVLEGHSIGNHTYSHPLLAPVEPVSKIKKELEMASNVIESTCGIKPVFFRPPHGWRSPWMMNIARKEGYTVITWTISPDDWLPINAKTISHRVLSKVAGGSIILLHDGLETKISNRIQTVESLSEIIQELKSKGYEFVTIDELIENTKMSSPIYTTSITKKILPVH